MNTAICDMYNYKSEEDEMMELTMVDNGMMMMTNSSNVNNEGGSHNGVMWTPVGLPKQNKVVCVGRICNEVRSYTSYCLEECVYIHSSSQSFTFSYPSFALFHNVHIIYPIHIHPPTIGS